MGGCRCSYRSCSAKSDGKIHMFHYPVFDKVRCHQWLTNARKLEFLNLKVSQLKNRVVCQHHFQPHNFMNFKMDKLKFDAVPTENGPFCNSEDGHIAPEVKTTIDPDEIDIEPLSIKDKVASLKVKFSEFLCNTEVEPTVEIKNIIIDDVKSNFGSKDESTFKFPYRVSRTSGEEVKKHQIQPMLVVPPFSDSTHQILVPKTTGNVPDIEFGRNIQPASTAHPSNKVKIISEKKITTPLPVQGRLEPVSPSLVLRPRERQNDFIPITQNISNKENDNLLNDNLMFYNTQSQTQNVTIEQMSIDPQFLEAQSRCTFVVSPIDKHFGTHLSQPIQFVDSQPQDMAVQNEENNNRNERKLQEDQNHFGQNRKPITASSPSGSQVKGKIPPERIAAIEEKRKFNKKLRDMIEFCLEELDTPEKQNEKQQQRRVLTSLDELVTPEKQNENQQQRRVLTRQAGSPIVKVENLQTEELEQFLKTGERCAQQRDTRLKTKEQNQADSVSAVGSHLSKEPNLPSTGEYAMAALEERLKKMEEKLLRKIDQNSQRILDLKSTIELTSTVPVQKASVNCQTKDDEETYKKQLFKEISQFLGPQSKSIIYEEMFLNKFSKNTAKTAAFKSIEEMDEFVEVEADYEPPKCRRRRRK